MEGEIKTGVDRLIELVRSRNEISLKEASKELAMPESVLKDWAMMLSQRGILSIEYRITGLYLVSSSMNKEQKERMKKDIKEKKEIIVRRAKTSLDVLDEKMNNINELKKKLELMKESLGKNVIGIKSEINQIKSMEENLKKINDSIDKENKKTKTFLEGMSRIIDKEEDRYYRTVLKIGKKEKQLAKIEKSEKKGENYIEKKLKKLKSGYKVLTKKLPKEERMAKKLEREIKRLENFEKELRKNISIKMKKLELEHRKKKIHLNKMNEKKKKLIRKIMIKSKGVEKKNKSSKNIYKYFISFMRKRDEIQKSLDNLKKKKEDLREKIYELERISPNVKEIDELKALMNDIESKEISIKKELSKISNNLMRLNI